MLNNIPLELRAYQQYVVWRYEESDSGRPTKVPYCPRTTRHANVNDPSTWTHFDTAVAALASNQWNGIGFVLTEKDPFGFIDLDQPKKPNGDPLPQDEFDAAIARQRAIYNEFDSYAELSPSGNGLHIIIKGSIPNGRKRSSVEVYSDTRFMTMTGNILNGEAKPINDHNELFNSLWGEMGKGRSAELFYAGLEKATLTEEEILEMAASAANGEKFYDLYHAGNWEKHYPTHSEADFALINIIGFYSKNRAQTQDIYLKSKIGQREKSRAQYRLNYMLNRCFDNLLPPVDFDGLRDQVNAAIERRIKEEAVKTEIEKTVNTSAIELEDEKAYLELDMPAELNVDPNSIYSVPPGLVGEIAQFIYSQAPLPVPEIALTAAIGLMSGIVGKAYNISNTGLNQYNLLLSPTGCHAIDTEILMYDGSIKLVQNIQVGEMVMGPDSESREVLRLARGRETMVKIVPTKGAPFEVNVNHILSLTHTETRKVVNITVAEYLNKSNWFKHCYKLERVAVDFPKLEQPLLDAWFVGAMLGDGHFSPIPTITSMDKVIHEACAIATWQFGVVGKVCKPSYEGNKAWQVRFTSSRGKPNKLTDHLKVLGLYETRSHNKFIPDIYKLGSFETRSAVLAGLLDTDGHMSINCYDYISKSEQLANDVAFVARSLGFAAYVVECEKYSQRNTGGVYFRVSISGELSNLTLKMEHKKASIRKQKKDVLVTGFTVEVLKEDNFYGFHLNKDHLYLTSDFTIHHNSGKEAIASGINKIMRAVRQLVPSAGDFIGPAEISSPQALIKCLADTPSIVSLVGEFGLALKQMAAENAAPAQLGLRRMLLDLFNKSGESDQVQKTIYSDKDKNTSVVNAPSFSLIGESTPSRFYEILTESMIAEGLLPRFNIIENLSPPADFNEGAALVKPSEELIRNVATLCATSLGLVNQKKVLQVQESPEAKEILRKFRRSCQLNVTSTTNEVRKQLWTRAHIKALKLAATVAIGENMHRPIVSEENANWAIRIVVAGVKNLYSRFENGEVGLDNDESKQIKAVIEKIKSFIISPWDRLSKTAGDKVFEQFHKERIIPYAYIQHAVISMATFRKDKMGATNALKRALKTLVERGDLEEVGKADLIKKLNSKAVAYMVVMPHTFGI